MSSQDATRMAEARVSSPSPQTESDAIYIALAAGCLGAIYGLIIALASPALTLAGEGRFGLAAAWGSAAVAATSSAIGYWRARSRADQAWRRSLPAWKFTVNTLSVVIVHAALAFLAAYALYLLLALGFIGLPVVIFWAVVLMAVTLGLSAYIAYLSSSSMTTRRMSSLLMAFIGIGTLTAMITSPDPEWWSVHFSQLGTSDSLSSWMFNGTLIAGGLLVTTFAVYIAHDVSVLVDVGVLGYERAPQVVSALFVVMGAMLACVGIFPVDVQFTLHNLSASGMALVFLGLLFTGPRLLRGLPRTYFLASWAFLAATLASLVLFIVQYFSLTAFEIIVFALIFGWIAVFIRFLAAAQRSADASGDAL